MHKTKWIFYSGSSKEEAQQVFEHYLQYMKRRIRFKNGDDIFTTTITHLTIQEKDAITCGSRDICTYQVVASLTFRGLQGTGETEAEKELRLYKHESVETARDLGYRVSVIADIREANSITAINDIMTYARVNEVYDPAYL